MATAGHALDADRSVDIRSVFPGNGEMATRCRAYDWSSTPLGPVSSWPQSLRTTVGIILCCRNPMFLWWGPDLIQIYNDAYRPSFGQSGRHPDALGMKGRDCWPEIWPVIGPQIEQVMTTGESTWHEDQLVPIERNGRLEDVWWTYSYSPVFDDGGRIGGTLVVCQETTQRVLADARLRAIYDGTYEFIGLLSPEGTLLEANRASLEFIGKERADVVGLPFWESPWFAFTPGAPEIVREGVRRAAAGEFVRYESPIHRQNGEVRTFDISLVPMRNQQGDVAFIVPEGRDVSEQRQLLNELRVERARLAEVFRQAPSFLAVMRGPQHVFELVNDAYYGVIGHREVIGKPIVDALPEVRAQGFVELLDRVFATGVPFVGHEQGLLLARTPGVAPEERFVDFVYQPLTEADGTRSGVVAHGSDVTEQVLARREVERLLIESESARAEAESANRVKSEFLAIMSHELRTPLNAIGGYADLMEMGIRGPITPAQREDLHRIQMSQRHLLGLINEVLNYAKLETGSVEFDVTDVDVREVLNAAQALVAPQARAKGLTLDVGACPSKLVIRIDAEKLRQIVVNLLSNAVKFSERAGHIEMSCVANDARVLIQVRDAGIGIPADKLDVIFDPFVQVSAELTRRHDGTGLGLAISRDLARAMGGDLTVESTLGVGSTFTLSLPLSAA
ncbi:MAG TPA: PAS domain-containing protein [Acidimicrobiia bacterium]|nr:PAS domain-containing protein [Acidimicrobiia bacterium]